MSEVQNSECGERAPVCVKEGDGATSKKRKVMDHFGSKVVKTVKMAPLIITEVLRCVSTKTHEPTNRGRVSMKVEYDQKSSVESVAQEAFEAAGEPGTCVCVSCF